MPDPNRLDPTLEIMAHELRAVLELSGSMERKMEYLKHLRQGAGNAAESLDRLLVEEVEKRRKAFLKLREEQQELHEKLDRLTQPPRLLPFTSLLE